jgi:hypothetical protein
MAGGTNMTKNIRIKSGMKAGGLVAINHNHSR